ncbi:hypothetical protein QTP86_022011 [Hemibagrus guttatus]|nr:hypothetical protein QTP86_022011 [Hemibagrus guttatus]
MQAEVQAFCRACLRCQQPVPQKPVPAPLIPLPLIGVPFERVRMDLVRPLPKSARGHEYILVMVDYATRYPEAVPPPEGHLPQCRQGASCPLQSCGNPQEHPHRSTYAFYLPINGGSVWAFTGQAPEDVRIPPTGWWNGYLRHKDTTEYHRLQTPCLWDVFVSCLPAQITLFPSKQSLLKALARASQVSKSCSALSSPVTCKISKELDSSLSQKRSERSDLIV